MTVSRSQPSTESAETRTVHDPFLGKDVQVGDKLTDRLRGRYACGPHLPNGNPEFGWRQFQAPPIQHEAAAAIESLSISNAAIKARIAELEEALRPFARSGWMTSDTEHTDRTVIAHMHPERQYEIVLSSNDFKRAETALSHAVAQDGDR